jgi:hypothetical protein
LLIKTPAFECLLLWLRNVRLTPLTAVFRMPLLLGVRGSFEFPLRG